MERARLRHLALETGLAVEAGGFVFLRDPQAGTQNQAQFESLLRQLPAASPTGDGWLCLATGGTSGTLRFARHDEKTLGAAAAGFAARYGCSQVNALDVLPAHHVSGFMTRIRSAETNGEHVVRPWKDLQAGFWPDLPPRTDGWFLSLVPTQLQRLLASPLAVERLRSFRAVFLGGGALWPDLAARARTAGVPVAICYGMTETAAMVVSQDPSDFAAGDPSCGRPLPHARVSVIDEVSGIECPAGKTGIVRIRGASVCRGLLPEASSTDSVVQTEDLGRFDPQGRLHLLGRRDAIINTGGEKVHPAEVEAVLRQTGMFSDVAVVGVPDPEWGNVVVACHPPCNDKIDTEKLAAALAVLPAFKRPKHFVPVTPWPRNEQGKLDRAALAGAARNARKQP